MMDLLAKEATGTAEMRTKQRCRSRHRSSAHRGRRTARGHSCFYRSAQQRSEVARRPRTNSKENASARRRRRHRIFQLWGTAHHVQAHHPQSTCACCRNEPLWTVDLNLLSTHTILNAFSYIRFIFRSKQLMRTRDAGCVCRANANSHSKCFFGARKQLVPLVLTCACACRTLSLCVSGAHNGVLHTICPSRTPSAIARSRFQAYHSSAILTGADRLASCRGWRCDCKIAPSIPASGRFDWRARRSSPRSEIAQQGPPRCRLHGTYQAPLVGRGIGIFFFFEKPLGQLAPKIGRVALAGHCTTPSRGGGTTHNA